MPTPFTHLLYAQRLLSDPAVPAPDRALLDAHRPAYLLGSIVADAHGLAGLRRDQTHFYAFDRPMEDHPWRVMVKDYPSLACVDDLDQRAFLAAYVMHISMDEIWSLHMVGPEFVGREWAVQMQRFLMLHILLISMDERDQAQLDPDMSRELHEAQPNHWLPFLDDRFILEWDELIDRQIMPGGVSETLEVYGQRLKQTPEALRAILDSPERMENELWANVTHETLARVEGQMLDHGRAQMLAYLSGN